MFPIGGGTAGAEIRVKAWHTTPLGDPEGWPPALRHGLNVMLNSSESMYLLWGEPLHFFFNDAYRPILGSRAEGAVGQSIRLLWADAFEAVRPAIEKALRGEASRFENMPVAIARNGEPEDTWWSFSFSPVFHEEGGIGGVCCFTRETTREVVTRQAELAAREAEQAARKAERDASVQLERRMQESRQQLDQMWMLSRDLLMITDRDGVCQRANPSWGRNFGYPTDDLIGRRFEDMVHPEDRDIARVAFNGLAAGEATASMNVRLSRSDGTFRDTEWIGMAGEEALFCSGRDVTRQLEIEVALRQSQKMEAVGQLTGGVAHDFNNLLTIIRASVDLLRRPDLPAERRARYIDAVSDTVDRAAKLVAQLLAFARRQALKPEVFDAGARLGGIGDMLNSITGSRVAVTVETPDAPCFVRADVIQFETALVNMAANARDAMNGEGRLTLRLGAVDAIPPIRGHGGATGPFAAVVLADTGTGIAPGLLARIFEPFFTTKGVGKGTGLGLSQVFGFAKQSGGDIDVASLPGVGTTFTLYLPRIEISAANAECEQRDHSPVPTGTGQRVLVVEDNVEVGRFCTQVLQDLGYSTVWSATAEDALERLGRDGAGFDIVFSDVVMPGMGGIAFAQELRRRLPALPIVLASGYSHLLAENSAHGFELLHKPYSAEELSHMLRRAMQTWASKG